MLTMPSSVIGTALRSYVRTIQNIEGSMAYLQSGLLMVLAVQLICIALLEMLLHFVMTCKMAYDITLVTTDSVDLSANIPKQIQVM